MSVISSLPFIFITQVVVSSPQQDVTFSSIANLVPAGTKHLMVQVNAAHTFSDRRFCEVTLNGNSENIYDRREFVATGSSVTTNSHLDRTVGQGVDIPAAGSGTFGGGFIFIPYALRTDNVKIWQTMGSSAETRLQRHAGVWKKPTAISSITLRPWQDVPTSNLWATGTVISLFAVDESHLVQEEVLVENGTFTFSPLPTNRNHLIGVLHLRSTAEDQYQGDRIYQAVNGDTSATNYKVQRLGGEDIASNVILDKRHTERRIGWTTTTDSLPYAYGSLVVLYPEYRNTTYFKPWLSQHAAHEDRYFPVSSENGRWTNTAAATSLGFSAQIGGVFAAGSRAALYRTNTSAGIRHVVGSGGAGTVTLNLPAGLVGLRVLVTARTGGSVIEDKLLVEINGDAVSENYVFRRVSAYNNTHETAHIAANECGILPGGSSPAGVFGCGVISFIRHSATDRHKHILSAVGAAGERLGHYGGRWKDNSPINSLTFRAQSGASFEPGSVFEVTSAAP